MQGLAPQMLCNEPVAGLKHLERNLRGKVIARCTAKEEHDEDLDPHQDAAGIPA
jgi:hypothetical protein